MKRTIIYCCLFFLPIFTFAQFDYSVDFVAGVDRNTMNGFFIGAGIKPSYNYRVGGNFNVRIIDNLFIKIGLRYAEIGIRDEQNDIRWPSEIGPNGFEPDPTLPRYFHTTLTKTFVDIPFLLRYEIGGRKIAVFFEFGYAPQIYINSKSTIISNISSETMVFDETETGGEKITRALVLGFGMNYNVTDKLQIFVQPTARKYPSDNFRVRPLESLVKSVGIEFGIRKGFYFEKAE